MKKIAMPKVGQMSEVLKRMNVDYACGIRPKRESDYRRLEHKCVLATCHVQREHAAMRRECPIILAVPAVHTCCAEAIRKYDGDTSQCDDCEIKCGSLVNMMIYESEGVL